MYLFKMEIGDWSGDGHEKCEETLVSSNAPVEYVRAAHFRMKEATGINIEELCSNYGDATIRKEMADQLKRLGFVFANETEDGEVLMNPDDMARLWVFLLQKTDPFLNLEIREKVDIPSIHFYGQDKQGRHIASVGYGLF